jgi:23S rRNA (cytosine1962-C5)-methyltransferase
MEILNRRSETPLNNRAVDLLAAVPTPSAQRLALRVTPEAQRALRSGHPWLFDRAIIRETGEGRPGDLAVIFDERRRFLAIGLYDPTSVIRVRVLHHGAPQPIDRQWLRDRVADAAAWRAPLLETGTTGYRLVHGENDGLPGLVIDRYDAALVVKLYSLAWVPWLQALRSVLDEACPSACIVLRLSRELQHQPEHLCGLADGMALEGLPLTGPVLFSENGLTFEADVVRGQKTGFFLDQRDNRRRVETLAAGRHTLNVFAYSGGFSLYAARGGAPEVLSLDASEPALASARHNFALNRRLPTVAACRHTVLVADAFHALAELQQQGRRFDLVIVDPPAFARQERQVGAALQAYRRLTGLALDVLAPGGTLVMSSCSSRVSAEAFFATVNRAARDAGRPLREFDRTGHPIDHPVRFPEGEYLKCVFASVP